MMIKLPIVVLLTMSAMQSAATQTYRDPAGRFAFSYPSTFGTPGDGTDDGFRDRVAAVAFTTFPAAFKGEAVLTRGFPLFDLQAVSGLYDSIGLQIFPDQLRQQVVSQLPRVTATTFCQALGQTTHLDPNASAFAGLTPQQRGAIGQVDTMRNENPHVVSCAAIDGVIVFDKERTAVPGGPTQHVFGAVRFLPEPYSTFQLIAGGSAPDPVLLTAMADVVRSFKTSSAISWQGKRLGISSTTVGARRGEAAAR